MLVFQSKNHRTIGGVLKNVLVVGQAWVDLSLPRPSCVAMGYLLKPSEPQRPQLQNGDSLGLLLGLLQRVSEIMHTRHLA